MVLAAATSCNNDEPTATDDPSTSAESSPTAGGDPKAGSTAGTDAPEETATVDTDLAVDPPGPMKSAVLQPDVLIFNQKPLSESLIQRIQKVKNVAAVETFGLGNVVI